MEIRKLSRRRSRSSDNAELGHFTFLLQKTTKKCIKIYNARAQLLHCFAHFCRRRRGLLKLPIIILLAYIEMFHGYLGSISCYRCL